MDEAVRYDSHRGAYLLTGRDIESKYRIVIPIELVEDELSDIVSPEARLDWIKANLPNILSAYTAKISGGWVKEPWGRVLVEEID